mgnify:CR=1 FL=1
MRVKTKETYDFTKHGINDTEKEIMQLHPVFSYELLKQQGVDEDALRLIRYHHQNPNGDGYPAVEGNSEYDIASQIMRVSDEYTALTEDRSYKPAMTEKEALNIIRNSFSHVGRVKVNLHNHHLYLKYLYY